MLKHCISLNVQIKNRSNENILAFLQYILVLFTLVLLELNDVRESSRRNSNLLYTIQSINTITLEVTVFNLSFMVCMYMYKCFPFTLEIMFTSLDDP